MQTASRFAAQADAMADSQGHIINSAARRSTFGLMARMSAMMFFQYWPLGTWGVTVGTYIAANTGQQGAGIFSAGFVGYSTAASAIGSVVSPVAMGFLSDRFFSAQYLVAVMHCGCALAAWDMSDSQTQAAFFFWLVVYFQCFVPAATLTNKIGLRHLADADAEYPLVRIFGTLGWIASGLFVGFIWPIATGASIEETRLPLMIGSFGHALMGLYSLTLPHTPPERTERITLSHRLRDSGSLLRNRPLVVFLVLTMLASVPSMAYNNYGNLFLNRHAFPHPAALMTLGQVSDMLVLWATPWLIARIGLRCLFVTGVIAWATRYGLLAIGSYYYLQWPIYAAILIHGPCYVFIYVIAVLYVDRLADSTHRGAAQGMLALASTGFGHLLGAFAVGFTQESFLTPDGVSPPPYHWTAFWLIFATISLMTLLLVQVALKPRH